MIASDVVTTRTFRTLAVVGAGNMGSGIAQKMASEGFDVFLVDLDEQRVARGLQNIDQTLQDGVARKLFTPDENPRQPGGQKKASSS